MTRVPDDWFVTGLDELRVAQAFEILTTRLPIVAEAEVVPLDHADGRILAAEVRAPHALPGFDHAAVDGYALRHASLESAGGRLPIVGRVAAGTPAPALAAGTAMRIFTGAPLPAGADTIVMQEDAQAETDKTGGMALVLPPEKVRPGKHIRRAGEEIAPGGAVLQAGRRIGPAELALAASLGLVELWVRRRLRVALLSTGDELAEAGEILGPAQRRDANRPLLAAMLRRLGCLVTDLGIARDEPDALAQAFHIGAASHDLIVSSGGVSAGEEDHVRAAICTLGRAESWRIALKPGRALAMGAIDGVAVIGLPGNPVAAFNTFLHVVRPAVLALSGAIAKPLDPLPLPAAFRHAKRAGRLEALRVQARPDESGVLSLHLFASDSSGWLTSLTESDGLALVGEDAGDVEPGTMLGYLPYAGLL